MARGPRPIAVPDCAPAPVTRAIPVSGWGVPGKGGPLGAGCGFGTFAGSPRVEVIVV